MRSAGAPSGSSGSIFPVRVLKSSSDATRRISHTAAVAKRAAASTFSQSLYLSDSTDVEATVLGTREGLTGRTPRCLWHERQVQRRRRAQASYAEGRHQWAYWMS